MRGWRTVRCEQLLTKYKVQRTTAGPNESQVKSSICRSLTQLTLYTTALYSSTLASVIGHLM